MPSVIQWYQLHNYQYHRGYINLINTIEFDETYLFFLVDSNPMTLLYSWFSILVKSLAYWPSHSSWLEATLL